jgi:hypothetical protein
MLEVLKALAAKVVGTGSTTMAAMILIYMLGTASMVNNFVLCVGLITFLALFAIVIQFFKG